MYVQHMTLLGRLRSWKTFCFPPSLGFRWPLLTQLYWVQYYCWRNKLMHMQKKKKSFLPKSFRMENGSLTWLSQSGHLDPHWVTLRLGYCTAFYESLPLESSQRLQLVRMIRSYAGRTNGTQSTVTPLAVHRLLWSMLKALAIIYRALHGLGPSCLQDSPSSYSWPQQLCSSEGAANGQD